MRDRCNPSSPSRLYRPCTKTDTSAVLVHSCTDMCFRVPNCRKNNVQRAGADQQLDATPSTNAATFSREASVAHTPSHTPAPHGAHTFVSVVQDTRTGLHSLRRWCEKRCPRILQYHSRSRSRYYSAFSPAAREEQRKREMCVPQPVEIFVHDIFGF